MFSVANLKLGNFTHGTLNDANRRTRQQQLLPSTVAAALPRDHRKGQT